MWIRPARLSGARAAPIERYVHFGFWLKRFLRGAAADENHGTPTLPLRNIYKHFFNN